MSSFLFWPFVAWLLPPGVRWKKKRAFFIVLALQTHAQRQTKLPQPKLSTLLARALSGRR